MKKIDWGMVLPLFAFVVLITLVLAAVSRGFVKNEMYIYDLSAPISWSAVVTTFTIIYFAVVEAFLSYQIVREITGHRAIQFS